MNRLYQTRVRNLVVPKCIRGPAAHRHGDPSQTRVTVPIAEGTPTFSPAGSCSLLGRIDDDAAHAHGQQGIALACDGVNRCGEDHVNGSIGFDSAPDDHHSNQSGTLPPSAYVRDASSNRECCGAASRSASKHAQNGSRNRPVGGERQTQWSFLHWNHRHKINLHLNRSESSDCYYAEGVPSHSAI